MTTTTNLAITEVAPSQTQKETTINNALEQLDQATQGAYALAMPANAGTVSAANFTSYQEITVGTISATGTVTVPLSKRTFTVNNSLNGGYPVLVKGATGAVGTVEAGGIKLLRNTGTDVLEYAGGGGGGIGTIVVGGGLSPTGTITGDGTTIALGTISAQSLLGNAGTVAAIPSGVAVAARLTITAGGTLDLLSINDGRVLGNITGGSAAPTSVSVSDLLDNTITSSQGGLAMRGASAWSGLAPGTNGQVLETQGAGANPHWVDKAFRVAVAIGATPLASQWLGGVYVTDSISFPANFSGSRFRCGTSPTASFVMDVKNNGTIIGGVTIAAAGTTATFSTTSGTSKSLSDGDYLEIYAPGTADLTIAGIFGTLKGTRI